MRLSELMKMRAVDSTGRSMDHVKDVRLEQRDGGWVVTDLVVGRGAFAERLGFIHGIVERPVLLARLLGYIGRHVRVVPWERARFADDGVVHVDARRDDLKRPEGYE